MFHFSYRLEVFNSFQEWKRENNGAAAMQTIHKLGVARNNMKTFAATSMDQMKAAKKFHKEFLKALKELVVVVKDDEDMHQHKEDVDILTNELKEYMKAKAPALRTAINGENKSRKKRNKGKSSRKRSNDRFKKRAR